jgi:hypothetical protein
MEKAVVVMSVNTARLFLHRPAHQRERVLSSKLISKESPMRSEGFPLKWRAKSFEWSNAPLRGEC